MAVVVGNKPKWHINTNNAIIREKPRLVSLVRSRAWSKSEFDLMTKFVSLRKLFAEKLLKQGHDTMKTDIPFNRKIF